MEARSFAVFLVVAWCACANSSRDVEELYDDLGELDLPAARTHCLPLPPAQWNSCATLQHRSVQNVLVVIKFRLASVHDPLAWLACQRLACVDSRLSHCDSYFSTHWCRTPPGARCSTQYSQRRQCRAAEVQAHPGRIF